MFLHMDCDGIMDKSESTLLIIYRTGSLPKYSVHDIISFPVLSVKQKSPFVINIS